MHTANDAAIWAQAVPMLQVAEILNRYDIGFSELQPQFLELVQHILLPYPEGTTLSRSVMSDISHLPKIFELP